ncbi:hypothetical protein BLNAU_23874 [Blattamonas nauphoetae]|uniref:Uncharacterized protein n=1 Tax=Blattamonas nauphoetae TaxID=2049346 RepID=A0ABQ9WNY9_9EUKA|nr:hypothetical protein BLNAU_23874 [Blattamonas nauphoetae]
MEWELKVCEERLVRELLSFTFCCSNHCVHPFSVSNDPNSPVEESDPPIAPYFYDRPSTRVNYQSNVVPASKWFFASFFSLLKQDRPFNTAPTDGRQTQLGESMKHFHQTLQMGFGPVVTQAKHVWLEGECVKDDLFSLLRLMDKCTHRFRITAHSLIVPSRHWNARTHILFCHQPGPDINCALPDCDWRICFNRLGSLSITSPLSVTHLNHVRSAALFDLSGGTTTLSNSLKSLFSSETVIVPPLTLHPSHCPHSHSSLTHRHMLPTPSSSRQSDTALSGTRRSRDTHQHGVYLVGRDPARGQSTEPNKQSTHQPTSLFQYHPFFSRFIRSVSHLSQHRYLHTSHSFIPPISQVILDPLKSFTSASSHPSRLARIARVQNNAFVRCLLPLVKASSFDLNTSAHNLQQLGIGIYRSFSDGFSDSISPTVHSGGRHPSQKGPLERNVDSGLNALLETDS